MSEQRDPKAVENDIPELVLKIEKILAELK